MTGMDIPFNRASVGDLERTYLAEALSSGRLSGDGPFTARASTLLERLLGASKVLLTTSCTHALEMSALLLDIASDDEVIVPSFAFVSTANAFRLHGGRPRFADVRRDTLNLDETKLESLITPRTRAIVALHYGGVACAMEPLQALATRHGLAIVEDNAHGLFATYDGRPLGTFGCLADAELSRDEERHLRRRRCAGHQRPALRIERAEILREKGTDRQRFLQGQVDKYTWVDRGSSYLPADVLAALLLGQLEARERIQAMRRRIWLRYAESLGGLGPGERSQPAGRTRAMRSLVPFVPHDSAVAGGPGTADHASGALGHPGRIPLPAAASVEDGGRTGRPAGRLPGDRVGLRTTGSSAVVR